MSSGHYCDGCAQAYYKCVCNKPQEKVKEQTIKMNERSKERADEREACLKIISAYQIPVGNSSAGEIACEMTYGALKDIHDAITARGNT